MLPTTLTSEILKRNSLQRAAIMFPSDTSRKLMSSLRLVHLLRYDNACKHIEESELVKNPRIREENIVRESARLNRAERVPSISERPLPPVSLSIATCLIKKSHMSLPFSDATKADSWAALEDVSSLETMKPAWKQEAVRLLRSACASVSQPCSPTEAETKYWTAFAASSC